jgi:hypothetical protein
MNGEYKRGQDPGFLVPQYAVYQKVYQCRVQKMKQEVGKMIPEWIQLPYGVVYHKRKRLNGPVKIAAAGPMVKRGPEYLADAAKIPYGAIGNYQVMVVPDKPIRKRRPVNAGSRKQG